MMPEQLLCSGTASTLIGALIGALITALATLITARVIWRHQHYNEAAARFRAAFVEEIFHLRKGEVDVFHILTNEALTRHERAKIIFEPFLSHSERDSLDEAWTQYIQALKTVAPGSITNRPGELKGALSQIERLVRTAQPK